MKLLRSRYLAPRHIHFIYKVIYTYQQDSIDLSYLFYATTPPFINHGRVSKKRKKLLTIPSDSFGCQSGYAAIYNTVHWTWLSKRFTFSRYCTNLKRWSFSQYGTKSLVLKMIELYPASAPGLSDCAMKFSMSLGITEQASERTIKRVVAREWSESCRASEWVRYVSERAKGRGRGPIHIHFFFYKNHDFRAAGFVLKFLAILRLKSS